MISDPAIAYRLVVLYSGQVGDPSVFDFYEAGRGDSGICFAADRTDGVTDIFLRGSKVFWDWDKDLMLLAAPWEHDTLGPVLSGFALGMGRCWAEIRRRTKGPWRVHGHSLAAGRGPILTGLMLEDGLKPQSDIIDSVLFGEPKPGFQKLADSSRACHRGATAMATSMGSGAMIW